MRYERRFAKLRVAMLVLFLGACFLTGGASRDDVSSLVFLQPLAVICIGAFLLTPGDFDWRPVQLPLLLLGALATVMAVQLIPLPPGLWTHLPGHGAFSRTAEVAGLDQPWRPISLTPDFTLSSIVGLCVPAAVLVGFAAVEHHRRVVLLKALLVGVAASAVVALIQVSSGGQGAFYTYDVTNLGAGVGLFANRNHQATLLAMTWPLLAAFSLIPQGDARRRMATSGIAAGFAMFMLPLLLVTGSRAGMVLGLVGVGIGLLIRWMGARTSMAPPPGSVRYLPVALASGAVALIGATLWLSRAEAVQRLLSMSSEDDLRIEALPTLLKIAGDFFPVGAGFGSFDPLFRTYEPGSLLTPRYLNHAHNDLLELLITGGVPALLVAGLFVAWFLGRSIVSWRVKGALVDNTMARAGSAMIFLILLSSLIDYPLRTPLMMAISALACGWLGPRPASRDTLANVT